MERDTLLLSTSRTTLAQHTSGHDGEKCHSKNASAPAALLSMYDEASQCPFTISATTTRAELHHPKNERKGGARVRQRERLT